MQSQLKRIAEENAYIAALKDWLSGNVSGHLGPYMYTSDQNDSRWKKGHSGEAYYVGRDEKATLTLALKEIDIAVDNFLDLGAGGEASLRAKSQPIIEATGAKGYFPVDLSPSLAEQALAFLKNEAGVDGAPVITNFYQDLPVIKPNSLVAIMGLTIGNIETIKNKNKLQERLMQIFALYRKAVAFHGYFLVSIDANENAKEIVDCYDNPEFGGLVRSCPARAIDTSGFDYEVVWTPENYQLATGLRSNRDQMIMLDGEQFAVEEGEYLSVLNSYRFPVPFVTEAAERAGWVHQQTWSATGRTHYLLFGVK